MEFTAKQIAEFLNGRVIGDENITISKVCKIENGEKNGLSFLANPKYESYIYTTKASIVIVNNTFTPEKKVPCTLVKVADAYSAFASLLEIYNQYRFNRIGISSLAFIAENAKVEENCYVGEYAVIDKSAKVGKNCKIYPQVYIGENVKIGDNVIIYAGVKIYHDVVIGNNCILHSGAVIGADGFGFAPLEDGSFKKIPQTGNVIIEDDVEIGANTCVDRSTMSSTIIHKGVKLDNLCQVGHNVTIGQSTVMSAQSGLAGSTQLGQFCFVGGQVGFAGHITVGNNVKIGAQSGVMSNVPDNATLLGSPAIEPKNFLKSFARFKKLDELEKRVKDLEKLLEQKK